jgi:hypothetical protein
VLLTAWNPRKVDFKAYVTAAGILLEGQEKDLNKNMKLLNRYGPYSERRAFWETVKEEGLFNESNLVMGGDLNLTTSCRKVWGDGSKVVLLQLYFSQLFQKGGMVDAAPVKLLPTWRNGRRGQDYIAKRLDRFLIDEKLMD